MSDAWLALEDGTLFQGTAIGALGEAVGEMVFNTAMTGYQEILTDPSYKGQIVTMTYPHIGNYGVNHVDVESRRPWAEGFVVRALSPIASNWRSEQPLGEFLQAHRIVGMQGIDTRCLTTTLRTTGAMRGVISTIDSDPVSLRHKAQQAPCMEGRDLVSEVTCEQAYEWTGEANSERRTAHSQSYKVIVMDFGVKWNILRHLERAGCQAQVVPANTPAEAILQQRPEGVLLSNGPGDPAAVAYAIATIQRLIGRVPLFGICLGHQLLGLALGARTYKLKFGHHGANHPVKDVRTGQVAITAQNHGFAVDFDSMPDTDVQLTHLNLNDQTAEGMAHPDRRLMSVQYHPEAAPGPRDAHPLFAEFITMMQRD